jgi:hypothetical protein
VKETGVFCVNGLDGLAVMRDRSRVCRVLAEAGVPQPRTVVCDPARGDKAVLRGDSLIVESSEYKDDDCADGDMCHADDCCGSSAASEAEDDSDGGDGNDNNDDDASEGDDVKPTAETSLRRQLLKRAPTPRHVRGRLEKPFVEKPLDADDHNVYIYYAGGGVRRLFRKTASESSVLLPRDSRPRGTGSYVYQQFHQPRGLRDVKVYAVGPDYFFAQARKAPTVDGRVERNQHGREVRHPVFLTPRERSMCASVLRAFGQYVVGFDILRTRDTSYIIDVNGWSFVKGDPEFSRTCGTLIANFIIANCPKPGSRCRISKSISGAPISASSSTASTESLSNLAEKSAELVSSRGLSDEDASHSAGSDDAVTSLDNLEDLEELDDLEDEANAVDVENDAEEIDDNDDDEALARDCTTCSSKNSHRVLRLRCEHVNAHSSSPCSP